jgi:hypothetical protein
MFSIILLVSYFTVRQKPTRVENQSMGSLILLVKNLSRVEPTQEEYHNVLPTVPSLIFASNSI